MSDKEILKEQDSYLFTLDAIGRNAVLRAMKQARRDQMDKIIQHYKDKPNPPKLIIQELENMKREL